jgi:hypothetical protein
MKGAGARRTAASETPEASGKAASAAVLARNLRRETDIGGNGLTDGVSGVSAVPAAPGSVKAEPINNIVPRIAAARAFPDECCFQVIYFDPNFFFCKARGSGPGRWLKPLG